VNCSFKILLLDEEAGFGSPLKQLLGTYGYDVKAVRDSTQIHNALQSTRYDLLILDVANAQGVWAPNCQRLRSNGHSLPILLLTCTEDPVDQVIGLEAGADCFLPKPFHPRELVARVRALIRRQRIASGYHAPTPRTICFGEFRLDIQKQILYRAGEPIDIHPAQFQLLQALGTSANRPVGRHSLIEKTRSKHNDAFARSIDVRILRLRQLVEDDPSAPRFIKTVWGTGYMLLAKIEL
jgi:two-component system, OmpR family, phosphate regulon response regulator OmpR